jgi:Ras family
VSTVFCVKECYLSIMTERLAAWRQQRRSRSNSFQTESVCEAAPGLMEIDPSFANWEKNNNMLCEKPAPVTAAARGRALLARRGADENATVPALTRSRSRSFYEDDAAVEADLGAAVAAGSRGDKGHAPDDTARHRSPPHHKVKSGSSGADTPTAGGAAGTAAAAGASGAGAAAGYCEQRSNALKPNELRALSQGLLDASALHRRRAESSDFDDDYSSGSESSDDDACSGSSHSHSSSSSRGGSTPLPHGADGLPRRPSGLLGPDPSEERCALPSAADAAAEALLPPRPPTQLRIVPQNFPQNGPQPLAQGGGISTSSASCASGGASAYSSHLRRQSPGACKKIKILMLGDSAVGKSSLMNRFTEDSFQPSRLGTLGVDFKLKTVEVGGEAVLVQVS